MYTLTTLLSVSPVGARALTAYARTRAVRRHPDGRKVQDALMKLTGGRSVPRVFVDGKFIGGGDDTAAMARDGRLKAMLTAAGIM